jgi:hypothetical protein
MSTQIYVHSVANDLVRSSFAPCNDDYSLTFKQGEMTVTIFGDAMTMLKVADVIMTQFQIENEQKKHEAEEYIRLNPEVLA